MNKTKLLLIGELAKLAGVKPDSVRFYERNGLIPKAARTAAGYRVYEEAALKRLRFIKKAQTLGFSLDEIRRILSLRGQGASTCRCVIAIAEATLNETKIKLEQLQTFHNALVTNLQKWRRLSRKGGDLKSEFCKLIEES